MSTLSLLLKVPISRGGGGEGRGLLHIAGYTGRLRPKRVPFSSSQVMIHTVENFTFVSSSSEATTIHTAKFVLFTGFQE